MVREECDDIFLFFELFGRFQGYMDICAGGDTGIEPFLSPKPVGHFPGIIIRHSHDIIDEPFLFQHPCNNAALYFGCREIHAR